MRWKLALLVFALALPGVIASAWLALPLLVDPSAASVPLRTLQIATAVQGAIFVLMMAIAGAALSHRVGLSAPILSAALGTGNSVDAMRRQLLPGMAGGVAGAAIIIAFHAFAPDALASALGGNSLPLSVRILYGGITEEVLVRWGLMTLFVWGGWRFFQRGHGNPAPTVLWLSIILSALIFGVSHVPSVSGAMTVIPAPVIAYVTLGNAMFGLIAGYLYWRRGLEAAISAHVVAHVVAYLIRG